jgi:hypothetical protein
MASRVGTQLSVICGPKDDRLDRALGQAFDLSKDDLHRPVDHFGFEALLEHQLERIDQVVTGVLGIALGKLEIHQVPELDGFRSALVGHDAPSRQGLRPRWANNLTFVPTLPRAGQIVNHQRDQGVCPPR